MLQENLTELLLKSSDFNRDDSVAVKFEYIMDDPKLDELREKYGLDTIAGDGNTQSKALNLMSWIGGHIHYDGENDKSKKKNAIALLEYAFDKGSKYGLCCYSLSVLLSEVCMSVGIKARALWLMPCSPNDPDNHVVTMVYVSESDKWIMLDPSYDSYLSDLDENILSPFQIRQKLADREQMSLSKSSKIEYMEYVEYLTKDMFYFFSIRTTRFGAFEEYSDSNPCIYLCPNGFDLTEWDVSNLYFRNSTANSFSDDELKQKEAHYRNLTNIFAALESFWGK